MRMLVRQCVWCAVLGMAVLVMGGSASATMENFKAYKDTYPGKGPAAYSCKVCHVNAIGRGGDLNAYGEGFVTRKGAGAAKQLTKDDFVAVEGEDADGDGVSNGEEIAAGTDPAVAAE